MVETQRAKILIVDDEPTVCQTLRMAIELSEMAADTAEDGEEGWQKWQSGSYDALVVDKNLPGMSGVDLVRRIRGAGGSLPIFVITAYGSPQSAIETLHLGINGYLTKPFDDLNIVVERIEAAVAERRLTRISANALHHFSRATAVLQAAGHSEGPVDAEDLSEEPGLRILIVNKSPNERRWMLDQLKGHGAALEAVSAPTIALERLQSAPAQLVVVDMAIEEPDIFQFLNKLDSLNVPGSSLAPVVAVTATSPALDDVIQLIDLHVRAVIEKPLKPEPFRERLASVIDGLRVTQNQKEPTRSEN